MGEESMKEEEEESLEKGEEKIMEEEEEKIMKVEKEERVVGRDVFNTINYNEDFIAACRDGNIKIVNSLLQNNEVDIEARDEFGYTGFLYACQEGHIEIVRLLIKKGVNINVRVELSGFI